MYCKLHKGCQGMLYTNICMYSYIYVYTDISHISFQGVASTKLSIELSVSIHAISQIMVRFGNQHTKGVEEVGFQLSTDGCSLDNMDTQTLRRRVEEACQKMGLRCVCKTCRECKTEILWGKQRDPLEGRSLVDGGPSEGSKHHPCNSLQHEAHDGMAARPDRMTSAAGELWSKIFLTFTNLTHIRESQCFQALCHAWLPTFQKGNIHITAFHSTATSPLAHSSQQNITQIAMSCNIQLRCELELKEPTCRVRS